MKRSVKACAAAMAAVMTFSSFAAVVSADTFEAPLELTSISAKEKKTAELKKGVYAVYGKSADGTLNKLTSYLLVYDEESAGTRDLELGIGLPIMYEQENGKIMFHFADVEDNSPAEFKADDYGNLIGFINYNGEKKEDVKLVPVTGVTVDNFETRVGAPIKKRKSKIFKKGVYTADDGIIKRYFVFKTNNSGIMINKGEEVGTAFTCKQNGSEIIFDFGGEGDVTPATFKFVDGKLYGTFQFADGDFTECMRFKRVKNADPNKF